MKRSHWYHLAPLLILIVGLATTAGFAWNTARENAERADKAFEALSTLTANQIQRRLGLYEYGLRGARGALITGGEEKINRQRFHAYSQSREIDREFPGARGFGFIRRVSADKEQHFLAAARKDDWPNFQIKQLTPHEGERFVIQYIEPVERNRQAVGLDIASEINRRTAAMRALSTNNVAITEPITLVQADGKKNKGFLILLAAYRSGLPLTNLVERDAAAYGWSYAPLVMDEVMADFDFGQGQLAVRIHDYNAQPDVQTFFESPGFDDADNPSMKTIVSISVFGREWSIDIQARPLFLERQNQDSALAIGVIGVLLSALLAFLTYMLQLANERELKLNAADALQRANERYRSLVEGVSDYAIIYLDVTGHISAWNAGAEKIKGYTAEEAIGKHFSMFYPSENRPADFFERKLEHARQFGSEHDEGWRLRKDGSRFWGAVTITAIRNAHGEVTGYSKITRDLTEQRQQAIALETLTALQKAILDNAGIAIIATNTEGTITLFNPSAERLLGYSAEEVVGKLSPAVFHDKAEVLARARVLSDELGIEIEPGFESFVAKTRLGAVDTNEWSYITKTGKRIPVLLSATGLFDEKQRLFGFVGLAVDLTSQKMHEEELESARMLAEQATTAKGEFLANMSHEIRTPMNAILGMTQLVLQSDLQSQQRDYLNKAFSASKALLAILNDILDYSKIEAGRMELEQREMSIETTLANVLALFSTQAEQKNLELVFDAPSTLPATVLGDPLRISQVLTNLLSNAIKFTAQGTVTLKVVCEEGTGRSCHVRFSVTDTGIGMNAEQLSRLFSPFSQADTSITRRFGGTGLGLSISKNLVELMGGRLQVESREGAGSTFSFSLELMTDTRPTKRPIALNNIDINNALVVDDQHTAAMVLKLQLTGWGIRATTTDNGQAAMQLIETAEKEGSPFDLVLLDWKMPGMDGLSVVAAVEEKVRSGHLQHVPIIMLVSAHSREELLRRSAHMDVKAVLSKPVMPSTLFNTLTTLKTGAPKSTEASSQTALVRYQVMAEPLRGAHILLAEDNPLNQQVATAFLGAAGLKVTVAGNGREALELLKQDRFDAVLMDLQMPEMDGLEATRHIRKLQQYEQLPVLAMTAAVFARDREACLDAGMNDFIAKPIEPENLIQTLRKWIQPAPLQQANPAATTAHMPAGLPSELTEHPGIDSATALYRMAGDGGLYRRLLLDFAARSEELAAQLDDRDDQIRLDHLIHQIKGEVGNLGLVHLAQTCQDIELAAASNSTISTEALEQLKTDLKTMGSFLKTILVTGASEAPPADASSSRLSAAAMDTLQGELKTLQPLLASQRMQALEVSARIEALLVSTALAQSYTSIHQQIEQLKFKQAQQKLSEFIGVLDKTD